MSNDTMNVWYRAGFYHIRFNGRLKTFTSFVDAKHYIESALMSAYMVQPKAEQVTA